MSASWGRGWQGKRETDYTDQANPKPEVHREEEAGELPVQELTLQTKDRISEFLLP